MSDNRCANTEALNRYIDEQDKNEAIYADEMERMANELQPIIDELFAQYSGIDRAELRATLLEDIAEQL